MLAILCNNWSLFLMLRDTKLWVWRWLLAQDVSIIVYIHQDRPFLDFTIVTDIDKETFWRLIISFRYQIKLGFQYFHIHFLLRSILLQVFSNHVRLQWNISSLKTISQAHFNLSETYAKRNWILNQVKFSRILLRSKLFLQQLQKVAATFSHRVFQPEFRRTQIFTEFPENTINSIILNV